MDSLQPYRNSDESPLEALVARGPDDTMLRQAERRQSRIVYLAFALYFAFGLTALPPPVGPVVLVLFVLTIVWLRRQRGWRIRGLQEVLAGSPVPIEHLEVWQRDPGSAVVVDLVLAEPSRLAERAVRVTSPNAVVVPDTDCLHVSWARELHERTTYLAHLLATLLPHHRELGLVRVRFTYRARPPAALTPLSARRGSAAASTHRTIRARATGRRASPSPPRPARDLSPGTAPAPAATVALATPPRRRARRPARPRRAAASPSPPSDPRNEPAQRRRPVHVELIPARACTPCDADLAGTVDLRADHGYGARL